MVFVMMIVVFWDVTLSSGKSALIMLYSMIQRILLLPLSGYMVEVAKSSALWCISTTLHVVTSQQTAVFNESLFFHFLLSH